MANGGYITWAVIATLIAIAFIALFIRAMLRQPGEPLFAIPKFPFKGSGGEAQYDGDFREPIKFT